MTTQRDKILPGSNSFISPKMNEEEKKAIRKDPAYHLATTRGQMIEILHIPSGQIIVFKAYIDDFQDKYDSDWNSTDVYGRMDPIHQFQGTKRVISLDWILPAFSMGEARHNHDKCSLLFSMLYPNYNISAEGRSSATQISTAPLFKLKLGNLIQDPTLGEGEGTVEDAGLVGAISGFTYAPNIEAGFIDNQEAGWADPPPPPLRISDMRYSSTGGNPYADGFRGQLYPKEVKLSMEYTVFHTNPLGWEGDEKRTPGFPYGNGNSARGASGAGTDEEQQAGENAVLL